MSSARLSPNIKLPACEMFPVAFSDPNTLTSLNTFTVPPVPGCKLILLSVSLLLIS